MQPRSRSSPLVDHLRSNTLDVPKVELRRDHEDLATFTLRGEMCLWCLRFRYVGPGQAVLSEYDTIAMWGSFLSNCPACYPGSDLLHKCCALARASHSCLILYVKICKDFYFKNIFKCYN